MLPTYPVIGWPSDDVTTMQEQRPLLPRYKADEKFVADDPQKAQLHRCRWAVYACAVLVIHITLAAVTLTYGNFGSGDAPLLPQYSYHWSSVVNPAKADGHYVTVRSRLGGFLHASTTGEVSYDEDYKDNGVFWLVMDRSDGVFALQNYATQEYLAVTRTGALKTVSKLTPAAHWNADLLHAPKSHSTQDSHFRRVYAALTSPAAHGACLVTSRMCDGSTTMTTLTGEACTANTVPTSCEKSVPAFEFEIIFKA